MREQTTVAERVCERIRLIPTPFNLAIVEDEIRAAEDAAAARMRERCVEVILGYEISDGPILDPIARMIRTLPLREDESGE